MEENPVVANEDEIIIEESIGLVERAKRKFGPAIKGIKEHPVKSIVKGALIGMGAAGLFGFAKDKLYRHGLSDRIASAEAAIYNGEDDNIVRKDGSSPEDFNEI